MINNTLGLILNNNYQVAIILSLYYDTILQWFSAAHTFLGEGANFFLRKTKIDLVVYN